MLVGDIVRQYPDVVPLLMSCGLHCIGCGSSTYETLEEAAAVHGMDADEIIELIEHEFGGEE
ncbi:MAG: DUF1858 domain-containing protein [Clostridium sp.]|nr:DUF1858 domain-containing protein [Clostridium sp.]